ncbi:MAG: hypothetical protein ACK5CM_14385, partial [Pseudanabaena sp.]
GFSLIPKHKMAKPFCVFKTLPGLVVEFTKAWQHFCELVLHHFVLKPIDNSASDALHHLLNYLRGVVLD